MSVTGLSNSYIPCTTGSIRFKSLSPRLQSSLCHCYLATDVKRILLPRKMTSDACDVKNEMVAMGYYVATNENLAHQMHMLILGTRMVQLLLPSVTYCECIIPNRSFPVVDGIPSLQIRKKYQQLPVYQLENLG